MPRHLDRLLLEHDFDAEKRLEERGISRDVKFISCKGLVTNKELMDQMRRMLKCIQDEYEYPVDIEFTINLSESGEYSIDLLQCRPLQVQKQKQGTLIPTDVPKDVILLESKGSSMGICRASKLDIVVFVDPIKYYNMPYNDKSLVARLIGNINWHYRELEKHLMLIVPGRVGTSSPELGVPTAFSDISAFNIICEVEEPRAGYNPELSYGSHIFQDLVEAQIMYTAIFTDNRTLCFNPELLSSCADISSEFEAPETIKDIVHVYDTSNMNCEVFNDITDEHLMITLKR